MADVNIQIQAVANGVREAQSAIKELKDQLTQLTQTNQSVATSVDKISQGLDKTGNTARITVSDFLHLNEGVRGFVKGMESLIAIQLRWYAARALIFAPIAAMGAAVRDTIGFAAQLDDARAKILRWSATEGKVTTENLANTAGIMIQIKRAMTEYPLELKSITEAVEAFAGAGVKGRTIERLVPDIARLKTAFKEIDFNQFAVAFTGAFNTFGKSIKGAGDDVQVFRTLFEQMLRAQAVGIIRPEDFARVMQYMGQMSKMAGFTSEEVFGIAVAISDTGSRASNAARYAQGFMQTFARPETLALLERIGVKINTNKTLAANFISTITQLHDKMGKSGELSIKNQQILQQIMGSKEAARGLLPLIQDAEKVRDLIEKIKDSQGGLQASSTVMQQSVTGQWQIFKNIVSLTAVEISKLTGSNMNSFLGTLISMAQGLLVAADSTGIYGDKLAKLDDTGKTVYSVVKALGEIFNALGEVLSLLGPPIKLIVSAFATVVHWLSENTRVLQLLVIFITGKLSMALLAKIGLLKAVTSGVTSLVWAIKNLGFVLEYFVGATLPGLLVKLAALAASLVATKLLMDSFRDVDKEASKRVGEYKAQWATADPKEIEAELREKQKELELARQNRDSVKNNKKLSNYEGSQQFLEADKSVKVLEGEVAYLNSIRQKKNSDEKKDDKDQKAWLEDQQKSFSKNMINSTKEFYNALFAIYKSNYDLADKQLDDSHKRGLISDKEYYDQKVININAYKTESLKSLAQERTALKNQYSLELADVTNNAKLTGAARSAAMKAVKEKNKADSKKLDSKEVDITNKTKIELLNAEYSFLEAKWNRTKTTLDLEERLKFEKVQGGIQDLQWGLSEEEKNVQDSYSLRKITVSQYYADLRELAKKNYDAEVKLENARSSKVMSDLDAKKNSDLYKSNKKEQEDTDKAIEIETQNHVNILLQIFRKYQGSIAGYNRDAAKDAQQVYENAGGGWDGFKASAKLGFAEIKEKYGEVGKQLKTLTVDIADGMASAFQEGFFDFFTGKLNSLWDYINAFLKSVLQAMSKVMAQKATMATMEMGASLFGFANGGAFSGGNILPFASGGVLTKPVLFPMANGSVGLAGEAGYEGILPLKRGKDGKLGVTNYSGQQNAIPNINVELKLENKSSQELTMKQGSSSFDFNKLVITAIVEDYNKNGATRKLFKGVNG